MANQVRCCESYQKRKVCDSAQEDKCWNFPPAQHRFGAVHLDIVGPLPESEGNHCHNRLDHKVSSGYIHPGTGPGHCIELGPTTQAGHVQHSQCCTLTEEVFSLRNSGHRPVDANCLKQSIESYHPNTNGMVEHWQCALKVALKTTSSREDWAPRLPGLLLGLRARPIADASLSRHQLLLEQIEIVLRGDFVSLNTAELYGAQFYQKLKVARN